MLQIIFELPNSTYTEPSTPGLAIKPNVNRGMGHVQTVDSLLADESRVGDLRNSLIDTQLDIMTIVVGCKFGS